MTTQPLELLISVSRGVEEKLGPQIERQLREAVRGGELRPGALLPSTRDLAIQLGVSRPIVVDAYAQLAAEGYITLRSGARPRVSTAAPTSAVPGAIVRARAAPRHEPRVRYDFLPAIPDLSSFPRAAWLAATRDALATMRAVDLGYPELHGCEVLRVALAEYLGRVRGVRCDADQIVITSGFAQSRVLACRALVAMGATRLAVEDPGYTEWNAIVAAGLKLAPIAVDESGMRTDALERANADAVLVTPAHQIPTGVVMSGARRTALLAWLRARDVVAIEDDYDAEFRYDRAPVGALQSLEPERVVYCGTACTMLASALRIGWMVVPRHMLAAVQREQRLADNGVSRIEQHALATLFAKGEIDRHLRRMRLRYRARREALIDALAVEMPGATVKGIAAGLHATVELSADDDERAILEEARRRGIALEVLAQHRLVPRTANATLLLGYARMPEQIMRDAVRELRDAIRSARSIAASRIG
ncbi:MAG: PLP-dependent aminotransferase family protein [Gemmatimonadota bacterium]|nr:PLP-dependent aminotransferase family protein [Gemmatimonadota bacterium]